MFIEELGQHLQIASKDEAIRLVRIDRGFWNVISIYAPTESPVALIDARRVHHACFEDTEIDRVEASDYAATPDDLAGMFRFAESVARDPLLVHCQLGLSRSPAVALAWICRCIAGDDGLATKAVDLLLSLRPMAIPNARVLKLGLGQFLAQPDAGILAQALLNHPRLLGNRTRVERPFGRTSGG